MTMRSMRAAVLSGPRRLDVVEVPIPDCGADDVLIQVEGVGLCGSDFTMYEGHWAFPRRFVIGHEGYGRIVAVGADVRDRAVGSLVAVEPNIGCGACDPCTRGMSSLFERKRSLGVGTDGPCAG